MSELKVNFLKLLKEKKYSLIVSIIDEKLKEDEKTSGILNLCGVSRMMSNKSNTSLKLAVNDFKNSCLKETDTKKMLDPLKNFINSSVIFFDNEFKNNGNELEKNYFDDVLSIYNKNKHIWEKNPDILWAIVKIFKRISSVDEVIEIYKKIVSLNSDSDAFASYIFHNLYNGKWSQIDFLNNTKKINDKLTVYDSEKLTNIIDTKNDKINLAFLSSDIKGKHSVAYFLKSVINFYDDKQFNIFLYNNHNVEDDTTKEFKDKIYKSSEIKSLKDVDAINRIREDKIDIIIDLNGLSSDHRLVLFKNRLAPIQISWCGYTNTTGLNEMDFLIADKNLIKVEEEKHYSEKIIYMPNIWNCHPGYEKNRKYIPTPSIKKNFVTFGSLNNFRKINDEVIEVWSSILKKVKDSKLLLKTSFQISSEIYKEKFRKFGVLDSIIILPFKKKFDDHLNVYGEIDIALDTFPYTGVTTSLEAIWMNVPVVTMKGYNFTSRCGESINKNLNLEELIAENKQDYIKKSVHLAENKNYLNDIRKNIFENALKTPLYDKKKFSDGFFSSLKKIYK